MSEIEKKALEAEIAEELEDEKLDEVAGGVNTDVLNDKAKEKI